MDVISLELMIPVGMIVFSLLMTAFGYLALKKGKVFLARRIIYGTLIIFGLSTGSLVYQVCKYLYVNI